MPIFLSLGLLGFFAWAAYMNCFTSMQRYFFNVLQHPCSQRAPLWPLPAQKVGHQVISQALFLEVEHSYSFQVQDVEILHSFLPRNWFSDFAETNWPTGQSIRPFSIPWFYSWTWCGHNLHQVTSLPMAWEWPWPLCKALTDLLIKISYRNTQAPCRVARVAPL